MTSDIKNYLPKCQKDLYVQNDILMRRYNNEVS